MQKQPKSRILDPQFEPRKWHFKVAPLSRKRVAPYRRKVTIRGWQTASLDLTIDTIGSHAGANVGIAVPPGYVVLDVDIKKGGPATLTRLEADNGALPETLTAITPTGGSHRWFKLTPGVTVPNRVGIAPGLDVRADGGYVVAAPSTIGGKAYAWKNWDCMAAPVIADAPRWLLDLMLASAPKESSEAPAGELSTIPEGMRNRTLFEAAAAMRAKGFSGEAIEGALCAMNAKSCRPPLPAEEVAAITASACRYSPDIQPWEAFRLPGMLPAGALPIPSGRAERVSISDLFSSPPEAQRFLIDRILPCGVLTLLGAHGGAGKSMLALTAAVCLATGKPFVGMAVQKCRVLFYSGEDPAPVIRRRLAKICRYMGIDLHELAGNLVVLDATERPILYNGQVTAAFDALRLDIAEFKPGVIIVDNASDVYDANEIDRARVREFIRLLTSLGKGYNAAVLLLAHVDKNTAKDGHSSEGYSGSTAWHNSARCRLFLTSNGGRLTLEHQKSNFSLLSSPIHLKWTDDGLLIQTDAPGGADDKATVLRLLSDAYARGVFVSAASNSPNNAYRLLSVYPEFPQGLNSKGLSAVMLALEQDRAIERHEIKGLDRHKKNIFRPSAGSAGSARDVQVLALITDTHACGRCVSGGVGDTPHANT